jgi:hypothetical protein
LNYGTHNAKKETTVFASATPLCRIWRWPLCRVTGRPSVPRQADQRAQQKARLECKLPCHAATSSAGMGVPELPQSAGGCTHCRGRGGVTRTLGFRSETTPWAALSFSLLEKSHPSVNLVHSCHDSRFLEQVLSHGGGRELFTLSFCLSILFHNLEQLGMSSLRELHRA